MKNKLSDILNDEILEIKSVSGGCISGTYLVSVSKGDKYFVKTGNFGSFIKEANGLKEISHSKTISTPHIYYVDKEFLILDFINEGVKCKDFFFKFGQQLANMHKHMSDKFGFYEDNYIGASHQINDKTDSWCDFFFNNRLLFQYKLAEKNGYANKELQKGIIKIEKKISVLLSHNVAPSLLHGDLWNGNYLVRNDGNPMLIDPAVYYGDRETDIAMTLLFGGFPDDFYIAYNQTFPLDENYKSRINLYNLYHLLNHLNLFGNSYLYQCIGIMNEL